MSGKATKAGSSAAVPAWVATEIIARDAAGDSDSAIAAWLNSQQIVNGFVTDSTPPSVGTWNAADVTTWLEQYGS